MTKDFVIVFDIPHNALLDKAGDEQTFDADKAMRFASQDDALNYIDDRGEALAAVGQNPSPARLES